MITSSPYYCDADVIDVAFEGLLPGVAARIDEVKTATGVLQTDARTAAVCVVLGEVGVVAGEDETVSLLLQTDVDLRWPAAAHAVFEGVLDERDKEQGGHFQLTIDH